MAESDFEKLVRQAADKETSEQEQGEAELKLTKEWWPRQVSELFDSIHTWLRPLIESRSLAFERLQVRKHEELLGDYTIQEAKITLTSRTMTFDPVGTYIVGAYGRVDVNAPRGKVTLLLLGESRDKVSWHVAHPIATAPFGGRPPSAKPQRATFTLLTQELFQQLFVDLFGI
jgi:hypothetical protein